MSLQNPPSNPLPLDFCPSCEKDARIAIRRDEYGWYFHCLDCGEDFDCLQLAEQLEQAHLNQPFVWME